MSKCIGWFRIFCAAMVLLIPGGGSVYAAGYGSIIISEIMFNPDGDENAREYIELYNPGRAPVDIGGWSIGDSEAEDAIVPVEGGGTLLAPRTYALILDPDYFSSGELYAIPGNTPLFTVPDRAIGSRGLANAVSEPISLIDSAGDTVSVVAYDISCEPGHSWERIRVHEGEDFDDFAPSLAPDGTPGSENSVAPPPYNASLSTYSFHLDPWIPAAGSRLTGTIGYRNNGTLSLEGVEVLVMIAPDIVVGTCRFDELLPPCGWSGPCGFAIDHLPGGNIELVVALTNQPPNQPTDDDTLRVGLTVPVEPGSIILNEVMPAPLTGPEWVEITNIGDWPVDIRGWMVGDAGMASDITGHCVLSPGGYAIVSDGAITADVPVLVVDRFPALNNDGDSVRLFDHQGALADSMMYDGAERGISFERISPDMGGPDGWDLAVSGEGSTPGSENSISWRNGDADGAAAMEIAPNPFLESTSISYRLPFPVARVTLSVYDRRGRLVRRFREAEESGTSWHMVWDGRADGTRLPAGPYVLLLEALDKRSGRMVELRKPIVVGARL